MKAQQVITSLSLLASSIVATPLSKVKRQDAVKTDVWDDADNKIIYSNGWTHLTNQGDKVHDGTESYTNDSQAQLFIPAPVEALYNITIWAGKKNDRGDFFVEVDNQYLGTGHLYDAEAEESTPTQIVYQQNGIHATANSNFRIRNGGAYYLSFDYLTLDYSY
ncbi:hypothetical protein BT69DRAFT_1276714 [Atractiella rhizophila]|nr:hypothetical protein BT69DRAFT_1276714 [Atractiella rhizophila]